MNKRIKSALLIILSILTAVSVFGCKEETKQKKEVTYPKVVGVVKENDSYTETELYVKNEETDRKINCLEVVPKNTEGKLPFVIYVHGGSGVASSLITEPEALAPDGIAGITFECCGCCKTAPKSDGKEIYSAHYSSRISDLEAVLKYVKTLDYVDNERIYLYGQSYGGLVSMFAAPNHNDDFAGMILESSGIGDSISGFGGNGIIEKYVAPDDYLTYMKQFKKDIIICCSEGDSTGAYANGQNTERIYSERTEGNVTFYSCPEGEHSFNSFSQEGKEITLNAMKNMILD